MSVDLDLIENEFFFTPTWLKKKIPICDDGLDKNEVFAKMSKDFLKYVEGTPEFRQLRQEMKEILNLKSELTKKKGMIRDERVMRAALEKKLSAVYGEIKQVKDENTKLKQTVNDLKAAPGKSQKKLDNLKTLVDEMRAEIKRLQPKDEALAVSAELDEISNEPGIVVSTQITQKKIGIIGGYRPKNFCRYPNVMTMTGHENLEEYDPFVKACDVVVVLTQHIGHYPMWTAKALCVEYGKPILYTRHANIPAILQEIESGRCVK